MLLANTMSEKPDSLSSGFRAPVRSTPEVDILLDASVGADTSSRSVDIPLDMPEMKGYDVTVPEELRRDRLDTTLEAQQSREVRFQNDCLQKIQVLRELEGVTQESDLPDFSRVSAEIPEELKVKIDELSQVLKSLNLYATVDLESVKKELGNVLRRSTFAEAIALVNENITASKSRIKEAEAEQVAARLKADAAAEAKETEVKAQAALERALETMKEEEKIKPMPVAGEPEPQAVPDTVSRGSFFAGIKRFLSKK